VAGVVAGVPWCDTVTGVVDVLRWRAALPAAVGVRVSRLPKQPYLLTASAAALAGVRNLGLPKFDSSATTAALLLLPPSLRVLKVMQPRCLLSDVSFAHLTALVTLDCDDIGVRVDRLPLSLRELRLSNCSIPPTADFRHLADLRVLWCTSGKQSSATVASLPPSLEVLWLTGMPPGVSLAHLPRLRVLRGGHINAINADTVASLPPSLLELDISESWESPSFAHLHALQTLRASFSDCHDASLASLPPSLVTLDISRCKSVTPAAALPHLPALTTLSANRTSIGDALVASLPARITKLSIVDCPGVTFSATLDHLPTLRELNCSGTDLSPAVLAACRARGCVAPADGVLRGHDRSVNCLAVMPGGRLASGDRGGTVRMWDVGRQNDASAAQHGVRGEVKALAVLPDSCRLAVGCVASSSWRRATMIGLMIHTVSRYDPTRATPVDALRGVDVCALAVLADGLLAAGCGDCKVWIVDADSAAGVAVLAGHAERVTALTVLPDGRLASGSGDGSVRLWDVGTRECVATLPGHTGDVWSLAALPDGRLASGEENGSVRLWDVDAATCLDVLTGHTGGVNALTALPDGRLASGFADGTIRLWTLRRGAGSRLPASFMPTIVLGRHSNDVTALAALSDGRLASSDGLCVRLWQPPPPPPEP